MISGPAARIRRPWGSLRRGASRTRCTRPTSSTPPRRTCRSGTRLSGDGDGLRRRAGCAVRAHGWGRRAIAMQRCASADACRRAHLGGSPATRSTPRWAPRGTRTARSTASGAKTRGGGRQPLLFRSRPCESRTRVELALKGRCDPPTFGATQVRA